MASGSQAYSVEQEISAFFDQTSTTRSACDIYAKKLVGGDITLVPIQGACSYTVYAGLGGDSVIQFRLKSLFLPLETLRLAYSIYGSLVPHVRFEGQIGEDKPGKQPLCVYSMARMKGISRLEFVLAHGFPEHSPENCTKRLTLVTDTAHFFALSWNSPQKLSQAESEKLQEAYETDLRLLHSALPKRFRSLVQECLGALPAIMALPTVLTHKDFGDSNILVDSDTCHLSGVIDWAEATIEPFGINLYSIQKLMGKFHIRNGYIRYDDYHVLHETFWDLLKLEVGGGWSESTTHTIQWAMVLGLLLSKGFTSRMPNASKPVPISDNESGAYNMLFLDSWLLNAGTKMI